MFGKAKVALDKSLWHDVKAYAEAAGYSSPEEFVTHVLEQQLKLLQQAEGDEEFREKLKGLGYIS